MSVELVEVDWVILQISYAANKKILHLTFTGGLTETQQIHV